MSTPADALTWSVLMSCICACGSPAESLTQAIGVSEQEAIYGADTRLDVYEVPDGGWSVRAQGSIAALVKPERLNDWGFCGEGGVASFFGQSVAERSNLCATERFASQPSLANCSATLIDDDLVVTAQHCMDVGCPGTSFAFGVFYEAEHSLSPVTRAEVLACRKVVLDDQTHDIAIVQLEGAPGSRFAPAPIAPSPPAVGDAIGLIGFPLGMPMKASLGCVVKGIVDNDYRHNCEVNGGSSGAGSFDQSQALFGVHSSGPGDLRPIGPNGCNVNATYDEDGKLISIPTAPQLATAHGIGPTIRALCETGWPSARLCQRPSACGDSVCSGLETEQQCPADCQAPVCGDAFCSRSEERSCPADCGRRFEAHCLNDAGAPSDAGISGDAGSASLMTRPQCGCEASGQSLAAALVLAILITNDRRRFRRR